MVQAGDVTGLRERLRLRSPAMLALAAPCLAGLGFLALFKAPSSYLIVNASALGIGLVWIATGPTLGRLRAVRALAIMCLAILAAPLVTGPELDGITRWIPLGPFQLHTGMLAIPLLACLAASDRDYGPPMLLAAGLICLAQPDAASGFALMGAATGLYFAWHDWKPGLVAILLFGVGLIAAMRGELAPQPFVERVLVDVAMVNIPVALALFGALIASFALMLGAIGQTSAFRYALAGSFAGFSLIAVLSNYPSILIGYGASPILGFALALGIDYGGARTS